jgi:hypothetical protein
MDALAAKFGAVAKEQFRTFNGQLGGEASTQVGTEEPGEVPAVPDTGQEQFATAKVEEPGCLSLLTTLAFVMDDRGYGEVGD